MRRGDELIVTEGEYSGCTGVMVGVNAVGHVIVEFGGRWRASFQPHHLDLTPLTLRGLLVTPGQWTL